MNSPKNIYFIVNGNLKIGLGHIYRCISIAHEAKKRGFSCSFLIQDNPFVQELLKVNKVACNAVNRLSWENPKHQKEVFKSYLLDADVIILDLLEEDFGKFGFLPEFNIKIVSITSFYYPEKIRYEDVSFYPGMEEKQNMYIQNTNKRIALYSGPKFLTFRSEFHQDFKKQFTETTPEILVTMGGSDPYRFTPLVVKALLGLSINYKATIILGTASTTFDEVEKLTKESPNIIIKKSVGNIAELMNRSTLAIINGGLTRYELALTGTPFIAISIHDIQFNITERLTKLVGCINLGVIKNISQKDIKDAIEKLISNKEERQVISTKLQKLIDAKGANRMLEIIENLYVD